MEARSKRLRLMMIDAEKKKHSVQRKKGRVPRYEGTDIYIVDKNAQKKKVTGPLI